MGLLRLFLAASVVITHTTPIFGFHLMPGQTAVCLFFMISGFYMQMILSGKYSDSIATFYTNRMLRLYPTYLIALALVVALGRFHAVEDLDLASKIAVALPNLSLFGMDVLSLFHLEPPGRWQLTFVAFGDLTANSIIDRAHPYLGVPTAWSLWGRALVLPAGAIPCPPIAVSSWVSHDGRLGAAHVHGMAAATIVVPLFPDEFFLLRNGNDGLPGIGRGCARKVVQG
jgi:hypothetical protein